MMSFLSKLTSMFGGGRKDSAERANVEELKQKIGEAAAGGAVGPTPMQQPQAAPGAPVTPSSFGPSPAAPTQPQPSMQPAPGMNGPIAGPASVQSPFPTQPAQPTPAPTPQPTPVQPPVQPGQPNGPQQ